jgi:hypothetical protein
MVSILALLLALPLAAQVPDLRIDLRTELGEDPTAHISLAPPGCWDGLLLKAPTPPPPQSKRRTGEATVEVWDFALRTTARETAFRNYLLDLRQRLQKGFRQPPPSHGVIELGEIMASDPSNPQHLDPTKTRSMQDRFNRLPPNGSPVVK